MAAEIERKFLVRQAPPHAGTPTVIRQGYLAIGPDAEVRVRNAGGFATLTVKSGSGLARTETEVPLTAEQFDVLWPATEGRRIEKRRSVVPVGGLSAQLDHYHKDLEGLAVVEVEFASVDAARRFVAPAWFGREVTDDAGYKNASLAERGAPKPNPDRVGTRPFAQPVDPPEERV
jgi:CYTH domain-containing protein